MKRERKTCPTCGKYLSNDVAALRGQVDVLTTEIDQLRTTVDVRTKEIEFLKESIQCKNEQMEKALESWQKVESEAKKYREAYTSKARMCESIQKYDHWLANRNLWQRIFNQLTPDK